MPASQRPLRGIEGLRELFLADDEVHREDSGWVAGEKALRRPKDTLPAGPRFARGGYIGEGATPGEIPDVESRGSSPRDSAVPGPLGRTRISHAEGSSCPSQSEPPVETAHQPLGLRCMRIGWTTVWAGRAVEKTPPTSGRFRKPALSDSFPVALR